MVERYCVVFDDEAGEVKRVEDPRGDYVDADDYDELVSDYDTLKTKFDNLKQLIEDFDWQAGKIRA